MENSKQTLYAEINRAAKKIALLTVLADIAHELRNPLAIISARSQMALIKDRAEDDSVIKNFESIDEQALRCANIIKKYLDPVTYRLTQNEHHDIETVFDDALTYLNCSGSLGSVTIKKMFQSGIFIPGYRMFYVIVFIEMIINAAEAVSDKGVITLKTCKDNNGNILVEINDDGAGIDCSINNRVFDTFFTTKVKSNNLGLGLAIVKKIMNDLGCEVWFTSKPGNTSFFLKFPAEIIGNE